MTTRRKILRLYALAATMTTRRKILRLYALLATGLARRQKILRLLFAGSKLALQIFLAAQMFLLNGSRVFTTMLRETSRSWSESENTFGRIRKTGRAIN